MDYFYWLCQSCALFWERGCEFPHEAETLPAGRALALSGRTQYSPQRWMRKIIFNILSKRTGSSLRTSIILLKSWIHYRVKSSSDRAAHFGRSANAALPHFGYACTLYETAKKTFGRASVYSILDT